MWKAAHKLHTISSGFESKKRFTDCLWNAFFMCCRKNKGCKKLKNILKSIIKWDEGGGKTHKVG